MIRVPRFLASSTHHKTAAMQALKYADQSIYNALGAAVFAEILQIGVFFYEDEKADAASENQNYGQQISSKCTQSNEDGTMDKSVGAFFKGVACGVVQGPVIAWKDIGNAIGGSAGSDIAGTADLTSAILNAALNPFPAVAAAVLSFPASFFVQDQAVVVAGSAVAGMTASYLLNNYTSYNFQVAFPYL